MMAKGFINKIDEYYSSKLHQNGASSAGVDWNSIDSHYLRFDQLTTMINNKNNFSILDYGCGYGELINYLNYNKFKNFNYLGFDISKDMIVEAEKNQPEYEFLNEIDFDNNKKDYVIANGLFNVKLDIDDKIWLEYIKETLIHINNLSIKAFSFNILTKYSDEEFMKDYLYYADPLILFDFCKKNFSKYVILKHDYPLYEFTIIVKK